MEFFEENFNLITQIVGFCAMAVSIMMYQCNRHRNILLLMILCSTLWCTHFGLLGHWTAVAMNGMNVVRSIVFCFRDKIKVGGKAVPVFFIVLSAILTAVTFEDMWSLVPLVASVFAITGTWQTDPKRLRRLTIPVCLCWFFYNIFHNSWAGTANEVFTFCSIIVAIVRYDVLKRKEKSKDSEASRA